MFALSSVDGIARNKFRISARNPINSVKALFISCFCDSDGKVSRRPRRPLMNPSWSNPAGFADLAIMLKPLQEYSGDVLVLPRRGGVSGVHSVAFPDWQPPFRRLAVPNHFRCVLREAFAIELALNLRHCLLK